MRDRRRATLLLIESRDHGLWLPVGRPTLSGFVPARVVACPECERGVVRDRFGREAACSRCGGVGRLAFDPMDVVGARVGSAATASAPVVRTVACDACAASGVRRGARCPYCGGEGRRPQHVFELRLDLRDVDERDPLAAAIDERSRSGSYRELDRVLGWLREVDADHCRQLLAVVDAGDPVGRLEPYLGSVVARMPDPIRVPAEVVANARERAEWRRRVRGRGSSVEARRARDAEIRRSVRRGVPVQRAAFEFGLSVAQVYRVVKGGSTRVDV